MDEPSVSHQEEPALIERARNGDAEALDHLIRRHQQQVFAVALRMLGDRDEAQDVAQDVFVRAYQGLGGFRQEAKLSTWLIAITMNLCRNRRRWWARRRRVIVASLDEPLEHGEGTLGHQVEDPAPRPSAVAQSRERQQQLAAALAQLDEPSRAVVVLRDVQGYAYEEIAQVLEIPVGTVRSRLSRARLQLRALLDGKL